MINQYLQGPPSDIRNVQVQPRLCSNFNLGKPNLKNDTMDHLERYPNCYSFHENIFKNVHEANDFCKNAFGKSKKYTGELAFGHFPHYKHERLPGKSQIWTYVKPGVLHDIEEFVCSCQSSHNNTFIKLKDNSNCSKAKDSKIFNSKFCPSEFNIRTVCAKI